MKKIYEFVCKHFDFGMQNVAWISLITALVIIPLMFVLPEKFGYENGVIENIQMAILFIGVYFAFRPKTDKKFFTFVVLLLSILMIREVNCFRTIFFYVPGEENSFYRWSEIKYGYLAHPLFGVYIGSVAIYFLKNKLLINLWEKIRDIKLPLWNFLFLITGIILGLVGEEIHSLVVEEGAELLFYVALIGFVYLYSQDKRFIK